MRMARPFPKSYGVVWQDQVKRDVQKAIRKGGRQKGAIEGGVVEHLLGRVVDHDRCFEILHLRFRAEDELDRLLEGRAVSFLRRLDVLPEINPAASLAPLVVHERFMDEVRVALPHRNANTVFGNRLFAAHFL